MHKILILINIGAYNNYYAKVGKKRKKIHNIYIHYSMNKCNYHSKTGAILFATNKSTEITAYI